MSTATQKQNTAQQQTEINIQLFAYREEALTEAKNSRPANTRRAYEGKQTEWEVGF